MKLYTYWQGTSVKPAAIETHEARRLESGNYVVQHAIAGELIHKEDVDGGRERYSTTPERALRAYIERSSKQLAAARKRPAGERPTLLELRDWRAALEEAQRKLAALKDKP